jgi:hypothetical protein
MSIKQGFINGLGGLGATALLAGAAAMAVMSSGGIARAAAINVEFGGTGTTSEAGYATPYTGVGMDTQDSGTVWNQSFQAEGNGGQANGITTSALMNSLGTSTGVTLNYSLGNPQQQWNGNGGYGTSSAGQDDLVPGYMQGQDWSSPYYTGSSTTPPTNAPNTVQINGLTPGANYQLYLYSSGPFNEKSVLFTLAAANTPAGTGSYMLIDPYTNSADVGDPNFNANTSSGSGNYTMFASGASQVTSAQLPSSDPATGGAGSQHTNWGIFNAVAGSNGEINFSFNIPSWDMTATEDGTATSKNWMYFNALQIQPVSTPEPATVGLFAVALGGILLLRRRAVGRSRC